MRLTLKWKLFYFCNAVMLLVAGISLTIILYQLGKGNIVPGSTADMFVFFGFIFGLLAIAINSLYHLFVLHKYFPDNPLPRRLQSFHNIILAINIVTWFAILLLFGYGFYEEVFSKNDAGRTSDGTAALIILFIVLATQGFILLLQTKLIPTINRNNLLKMDNLIESIGKDQ